MPTIESQPSKCARHAQAMEHCRVCADTCRRCEQTCQRLLAVA